MSKNKNSAFYLCTSRGQQEIRDEVDNLVQDLSTAECLSLTYIKSRGPVYPGGKENL